MRAAKSLWTAWDGDAVAADGAAAAWARPGAIRQVAAATPLLRMRATPTVPAGPGGPVLFQAA